MPHCLVLAIAISATQALPLAAAEPLRYMIHRTETPITIDGKLEEPGWFAAESVGDFQFAWYQSGKKEQTVAKMLWDDEYLYVAYICQDAHIAGTRTERDSSVWKDDCVEVFTAPNPKFPFAYFNMEMNVRGAILDNYSPSDDAPKIEGEWNPDGIKIKTTVVGTLNDDSDSDDYWILEAAIPFAAFKHIAKHTPPRDGDVWHLNLNRLGGPTNEQFSQWSPGTSEKPQYHRPQDFGRVIFSTEPRPRP